MTGPLLAIETSQRDGSVAVRTADGVVHVEWLQTRSRADDDLQPAIDRAVRAAGLRPRDLAAVGVSVGPGGFTGVRIGVSAAKAIAAALDRPTVAVPTAHVALEALGDVAPRGELLVVLAVKRDAFWATRVRRDGDDWRETAPPGPDDAASCVLDGVTDLVGDAFVPDVLRDRAVAAGVTTHPLRLDAGACAAVAARRLALGAAIDPLALRPIYPRRPEAVDLWDRRHGLADR